LYLSPGPHPQERKPEKSKFYYLSRHLSGDLIEPIWGRRDQGSIRTIREVNAASGNFSYHVTFSSRLPGLVKAAWHLMFYICKGVYLHYFKKKFDVIITYGSFTTGIAGYAVKKLTGAKLIVEVPGNPKKSFFFDSERPSFVCRLKAKMSEFIGPWVIKRADHVRLLYYSQLNGYTEVESNRVSVFHDFVPVHALEASNESCKYVLFLGFPWYLKGVDVLIKAFNLIAGEFPEYRLKVVGFCPDKTPFFSLTAGNDRIELSDPVMHNDAMRLMAKCSIFVLPSRTEAMGRVLLEAMALKKAIVASNVDGIPQYIKHGYNGLVFESENEKDLADKIRVLLRDRSYADELAMNGYNYVRDKLSEEAYVAHFKSMVEKVLES
jgi:glycosyltransferase involved in cell wall biosynthesis